MNIFIFFFVHMTVGLALVYYRSKLPAVLVTFSTVFLVMSVWYRAGVLWSFY
ncbi:hypothetical protein KP77_09380 [Jeotgalibacillus alimentarius]|uniref:Uncharacterized protein n=1 Tax=Jeotgalibacillus alimentarius TaxID=135826 RepID=A0A0C2W494_9BACL|nr:hypothetical protein [Jeotgalibacillus alimentarius]KIL51426.1 hypothetical protein KP77_09380 [Jeotgalibacillus alimentarius]